MALSLRPGPPPPPPVPRPAGRLGHVFPHSIVHRRFLNVVPFQREMSGTSCVKRETRSILRQPRSSAVRTIRYGWRAFDTILNDLARSILWAGAGGRPSLVVLTGHL